LAEAVLEPYLNNQVSASIDDNLDKMKALHELGYREESSSLLAHIKQQINAETFSGKVLNQYIQQEQIERSEIHFTAKELNEMAAEHFKNKRMQPALSALQSAFKLSPESLKTALNILKVLAVMMERQEHLDDAQYILANSCLALLHSKVLTDEQQQKCTQYITIIGITATLDLPDNSAHDSPSSNQASHEESS